MQNEIYFGYDLLPESSLEHFGIPRRSGRFPWGSGEDPYHHGADAPGGRKLRLRAKEHNGPIARIKKRKEAKAKEEREREKQAAIESGDPKKIAPYIRDLSDDELRKVNDRIKLENRFAELYAENTKNEKSAADRVNEKVKKINDYTSTGMDLYNNVAKIYNAFSDDDGDKLPIIGTNSNKKKPQNDSKEKTKDLKNYKNPETPDTKNEESTSNDTPSVNKEAEARKDFRREMATEYSKHLQNEAASKARKDFHREMADKVGGDVKREIARRENEERARISERFANNDVDEYTRQLLNNNSSELEKAKKKRRR